MKNPKKIVIISYFNAFIDHLKYCLEQGKNTVMVFDNIVKCVQYLNSNQPDIVVFNNLFKDRNKKDLMSIFKYSKRLIFLDDSRKLYLNSNISAPFSVYKKIIPKNKICKEAQEIEKFIIDNLPDYTIFRIAELYGPNIDNIFIHNLLHSEKMSLCTGKRDFLYEGDLIHAIEVAIETNACGIFDIASGKSIKIKNDLIQIINKFRKKKLNIYWRKKREKLVYNCENFKYYKWHPLVNLETGLKVMEKMGKI